MIRNRTLIIAGKGGVGKTTVAALLIGALVRRGETPILAIDADPNSNLNEALGMKAERTLGDVRDDLLAKKGTLPAGVSKAQVVDYELHNCVIEGDGVDLLPMGHPEGPECYCYVNTLLRAFIEELSPNYRWVVIDNEAGMEHVSRRTARKADRLLLVSDPSRSALRAAARIAQLAETLKLSIDQIDLVLNRAVDDASGVPDNIEGLPDRLGTIPVDIAVGQAERDGRPLISLPASTPAVVAADAVVEKILDA